MRQAAIVSTARTPIGRAYKGAYSDTPAQTLAGHAIEHAVRRAGVSADEIEDVVLGCALQQGATGGNVARQALLRGGLPDVVSGMTINRQCASGLMAIATAAKQIVLDGMDVTVGGGVESISLVQNEHFNTHRIADPWLLEHKPDIYLPMLKTAEVVAERYGISRAAQDDFALLSQHRTAEAQRAGRFDAEIVALPDRPDVTRDEGNRPETTLDVLRDLRTVLADGDASAHATVTAGNASQLSDGASACVLMEDRLARDRGNDILGHYRGMAVAGCRPDEMGIGPVLAIPRLLHRHGLKVSDIGLWEINEAFASQLLYCRDQLGIDPEKLNVDGGAISVGHPYGMTGSRLVGHSLLQGRERGVRYAVVSMCVGGGMGAAGLLEIAS